MTVLVLGATGSVGRQVVGSFLEAGFKVHGVARTAPPYVPDPRMSFNTLDVTASAEGALRELIETTESTAVVNAAGGWGNTFAEMRYSHEQLALKLVAELSFLSRPVRLVHFGSVHEYGEPTSPAPMNEAHETTPVSEYAQVKAHVSRIVLGAHDVDAVVLRCGNMCGPYPPAESFLADLISRIANAMCAGFELEISVANSARDYVDVRDAARAAVHAVRADEPPPVVNVGRGQAVPIRILVELLLSTSGFSRSMVRFVDSTVSSKGGQWTCLDIDLARKALDWKPQIDLQRSINDMWHSYRM